MTRNDDVATAFNIVSTHDFSICELGYACTTCDALLSWADLAMAKKSEKDFVNTWIRLGLTGVCPKTKEKVTNT